MGKALLDLKAVPFAETGDEKPRIRPPRVNESSGAKQRREIVVQLLIAGARQETDDGSRTGALLGDEPRIQTLLAQLVEIGMADVLGGDVALAIPLLLEGQ